MDRDLAYSQILAVTDGFGIGNSMSNQLLWAASRSPPPVGYNQSTYKINFQDMILPACSSNSACVVNGKYYDISIVINITSV